MESLERKAPDCLSMGKKTCHCHIFPKGFFLKLSCDLSTYIHVSIVVTIMVQFPWRVLPFESIPVLFSIILKESEGLQKESLFGFLREPFT